MCVSVCACKCTLYMFVYIKVCALCVCVCVCVCVSLCVCVCVGTQYILLLSMNPYCLVNAEFCLFVCILLNLIRRNHS